MKFWKSPLAPLLNLFIFGVHLAVVGLLDSPKIILLVNAVIGIFCQALVLRQEWMTDD